MNSHEERRLAADIQRMKANVAACTMSFLLLGLILLSLPR
jgi:hypothetical protein